MRSVIRAIRASRLSTVAIVGAVGALAAGCSSDSSRCAGSFFGGVDPEYTGSVTPAEPVASGQIGAGGDPRAQSAYNQLGSAPAGGGDGTTVMLGPGETLYSVATRYGVPVNALMSVNGIKAAGAVQPGQALVIPVYSQAHNGWVRPDQAPSVAATQPTTKVAGPVPLGAGQVATASQAPATQTKPLPAGGAIHTVTPGQTVYSLGRLYSVRPNDIIAANNLQAPYGIQIGQKVRIPGASVPKSVQPAASTQTAQATGQPAVQAAQTPTPTATPAVVASKTGIQAAELPAPQTAAYAPQNDKAAGTDTRAAVPEPAALSAGQFRWPVRGRIISTFGEKSDGGTNDGINISVPEGTSVRSAENGVVAYAGNELKGYGNLVLIRHADDWVTAYAHNSELLVDRGDVVSRGQVIAKAGQTGAVSTPQMHFELRKGSQPVDPLKHLASD